MKTLSVLTMTAVLALALPGMAAGQDAATDESIDDVTALIAAGADKTMDLSGVTATSTVKIVKLSGLRASASGGKNVFHMALKSFEPGLKALRSAVAANEALKAKLAAEGFKSEDVLAITKTGDGSVMVYVDDAV